jgi:hypothetical protein
VGAKGARRVAMPHHPPREERGPVWRRHVQRATRLPPTVPWAVTTLGARRPALKTARIFSTALQTRRASHLLSRETHTYQDSLFHTFTHLLYHRSTNCTLEHVLRSIRIHVGLLTTFTCTYTAPRTDVLVRSVLSQPDYARRAREPHQPRIVCAYYEIVTKFTN